MPQNTKPLSGKSQPTTKTILLVEDDLTISSFILEAITQETPYRAIAATDSYGALRLVQYFKPDLLILDYGLPGMNGIALYDHLRSDKELRPIPAILITANPYLPRQQIQQRQLIVFKKPFDLDAFLSTIQALLTSL